MANIKYAGSDKWKTRATEILNTYVEKREVYYDTTANWNAQTSLISERGVLYVYSDYSQDSEGRNIANIKVGDGLAYVVDLPFINMSDVTEAEKVFWNNKVRCYINPNDEVDLIFTTH